MPEVTSYRFDRFRVDLRIACLLRDETPVPLRRKSFDVLLFLVRNGGRVVSKDELMQEIWADVVVTDNSLAQCIKEIREALADDGQRIIRTAAKRGYVFVPAVTAGGDTGPALPTPWSDAESPAKTQAPSAARPRWTVVAATAGAALLVAGAALWMWEARRLIPATASLERPYSGARLSVAVLPFSARDGEDYFSLGVSADLAAALGRFPDLAVASPHVVSRFRSAGASAEDLQRQLNVRYLVEGSVLRTPEKIRIAVRLTDLTRAMLLWSESYDAPAADVFAIQNEITQRVAGALAVKLTNTEQNRAANKPPASMEAYDFVLRGRDLLTHLNRKSHSEARAAFERAIAIDPNYSAPYVGLGRLELSAAALGWTENAEEALSRAQDAARKAIARDEFDPAAHVLLGRTFARMGRYDRAVETLKHAVALNPSDPESYAGLGDALLWHGEPGDAIEALEIAVSMDPRLSAEDLFSLGAAYFLAGRDTDSIRVLERATTRNEGNPFIYALLAASHADSGRAAEADSDVAEVRKLNPFFDAQEFGSLFRKPEHREKLSRALKKAGL